MQQFFYMPARRSTIEWLPAYSSDVNPTEHLWKKIKEEEEARI